MSIKMGEGQTLLEPWWKTLNSLALKERRFESVPTLSSSIVKSTHY